MTWVSLIAVVVMYNGINLVLHAIFVLKYWVLSKKVEMILKDQMEFEKLDCIVVILMICIFGSLIIASVCDMMDYTWFFNSKQYFTPAFAVVSAIP